MDLRERGFLSACLCIATGIWLSGGCSVDREGAEGGSDSSKGGTGASSQGGVAQVGAGQAGDAGAGGVAGVPSASGGELGLGGGGAQGGDTTQGGAPDGTGGALIGAGGAGGAADVTPPVVSDISPADGTKGVFSNANIEITFSEAMDTASVAEALQVVESNVPVAYSLEWSPDSRFLTITPAKPGLRYGVPSRAREFTVTLGAFAKDLAGNALAKEFRSNFFTLRRINSRIQAQVAHWDSYGHNVGVSLSRCAAEKETFRVGSWSSTTSIGSYYGYVLITVADLGDLSLIAKVDSAIFSAPQVAPYGDFYPAGRVILEKLDDAPLDDNLYKVKVIDNLGPLATSAAATPTLDITEWFQAAVSAGEQTQLYRLSSDRSPDGAYAKFNCSPFELEVTYLTP